jgi:hypothetical protein
LIGGLRSRFHGLINVVIWAELFSIFRFNIHPLFNPPRRRERALASEIGGLWALREEKLKLLGTFEMRTAKLN